MPVYMITYDLHKKETYSSLYAALEKLNNIHPVESVWFVAVNSTNAQLCNNLMQHLFDDDQLIVSQVIGTTFVNLKNEETAWLRRALDT